MGFGPEVALEKHVRTMSPTASTLSAASKRPRTLHTERNTFPFLRQLRPRALPVRNVFPAFSKVANHVLSPGFPVFVARGRLL